MKILVVADEESTYLWDHYRPGMLKDYSMILSAGDLKASYLSFLVTMSNRPLLYVHGNHDASYAYRPPEGCECIDGKLVVINGVRILGLGGCMRYNLGAHQYTEKEMRRRIRKLRFKLFRAGGVDIVVSHAPVQGYGDQDDPAHRGFECFLKLIEKYKPKYWVYGHVHKSYGSNKFQRIIQCGDTQIINASGRYELEI